MASYYYITMSFNTYTFRFQFKTILLLVLVSTTPHIVAELPPVPYPVNNPDTEEKRMLGKILFWDEQLSSSNDVACGTCHIPASGGADPRTGVHPAIDRGNIDDIQGSPGVVQRDSNRNPVKHDIFGLSPQVTTRTAPSVFNALWAEKLFWDGRATADENLAALEVQTLETLSSPVEMSTLDHDWQNLVEKLAAVTPLQLASQFPEKISAWLSRYPDYPALFKAAYKDASITPERIAFAITTYERSLVADQTPWDKYQAGDKTAMSATALQGWQDFQDQHCTACHTPPLFTNNEFFNIGLRNGSFDAGRQSVTGLTDHRADMKVPSLRNTGLKNRYMHTGEFSSLSETIQHYSLSARTAHSDDIPGIGAYSFTIDDYNRWSMEVFIKEALTDPRVRDERYPFDRPRLSTEQGNTPRR